MFTKKKTNSEGLTLVELVMMIAVLAIVTAIVWPITAAQVTMISLESKNRSLTEIANFIRDWDRADGNIYVTAEGELQANYNGMDVEHIRFPDEYILVGDGSLANPYLLQSKFGSTTPAPTPAATTAPEPTPTATTAAPEPTPTATTVAPEPTPTATTEPAPTTTTTPTIIPDGTLQAPSTVTATSGSIGSGLSYVRTGDKVTITSNSANWEKIMVTYTVSSTQTVELTKKTGNGTTVGLVLKKISNTQVEILLPSSQPFTLTVTYNGGSTGYFFFM